MAILFCQGLRGGNFVVLKLKRLIVPFLSLGISYSLLKCAYFYMVGTICEIDLASKFLNLISPLILFKTSTLKH